MGTTFAHVSSRHDAAAPFAAPCPSLKDEEAMSSSREVAASSLRTSRVSTGSSVLALWAEKAFVCSRGRLLMVDPDRGAIVLGSSKM